MTLSGLRPVTVLLLAANAGLFARGYLFPGPDAGEFGLRSLGSGLQALLSWGDLSAAALWRGEWHRLLSCCFLHVGLLHFLFNMSVLLSLGAELERRLGPLRYAVVYLLSGLGGDLASVLFLPAATPTAGASGAIFGVLGAHLALEMERGRSPTAFLQLPGGRELLLYVLISVVLGVLTPRINNWGHAGGLLAGFGATRVFFSGRFRAARARAWAIRAATAILVVEACHYALFSVGRPLWHYQRSLRLLEAGRFSETFSSLRVCAFVEKEFPREAGAGPWNSGFLGRTGELVGYARLASARGEADIEAAIGHLERAGDSPFADFWRGMALTRSTRVKRRGEAREAFDRAARALRNEARSILAAPDGLADVPFVRDHLRSVAGSAALAEVAAAGEQEDEDPAETRRVIENSLARSGASPEGRLALAIAALRAGDPAAAEREAKMALDPREPAPSEGGPGFPPGWNSWAEGRPLLFSREVRAEARRVLDLVRKTPGAMPPPPHPLFDLDRTQKAR